MIITSVTRYIFLEKNGKIIPVNIFMEHPVGVRIEFLKGVNKMKKYD